MGNREMRNGEKTVIRAKSGCLKTPTERSSLVLRLANNLSYIHLRTLAIDPPDRRSIHWHVWRDSTLRKIGATHIPDGKRLSSLAIRALNYTRGKRGLHPTNLTPRESVRARLLAGKTVSALEMRSLFR